MAAANSSKLNSVHVKALEGGNRQIQSVFNCACVIIIFNRYNFNIQILTLSIIAKIRSTRFSGVFSSSGSSTVFP